MKRFTAAWAFLLGLIALLVAVNVAFRNDDDVRTDLVTNVVYLAAAAALMSLPVVKLERGRLTLTGIIAVAAAILLNPLDATLVSLLVGIENIRAPWPLLGNSLIFAVATSAGALISVAMGGAHPPAFAGRLLVVLTVTLANLVLASVALGLLRRESPDADRHLFHSRAVEGVVHNLRNHVATALAYLKEIDARKLERPDRESLETATDAANDAVAVLRDLAQGATPKVSYAPNPVDLNELISRAVGMARPRARGKEIQFAVHEAPTDVAVKADPLLMREVMTNLLNNAIDAVSVGGRVDISTGRRNNGWAYVSVADSGTGVSDDHRHHLFEPHFTTKEGGTGLGLFMSYGIVREHQGQLTYEGGRRGAVFTVSLPPFNP